jgi:hypothetical protein
MTGSAATPAGHHHSRLTETSQLTDRKAAEAAPAIEAAVFLIMATIRTSPVQQHPMSLIARQLTGKGESHAGGGLLV